MTSRTDTEAIRRVAALVEPALDAALDAIAAPAFIARSSGDIVRSNAAGRAALRYVPGTAEAVAQAVRESRGGGDGGIHAVSPAGAGHSLVVDTRELRDPRIRAAVLRERHALTARQAEVLLLLARGAANRTIALALGCTVATVELHVTALLQRTGCENRTALVASFWARP